MIAHIFKLIWNKKGSNALMILEIFLSFLVLFGVLSYILYNTDRLSKPIGFETDVQKYVLMGDLPHLDSLERIATIQELKIVLENMDLIEEVAFSNNVYPFSGNTWTNSTDDNGYNLQARYIYADENLAKANNIVLNEGRWFVEEDQNATYPPLIVNQYFKDEFFPYQSIIDSIITFLGEHKIIGVVEDFRYGGEFEKLQNTFIFYRNAIDPMTQTAYLKMDPAADVQYEEKINNAIQSVLKTSNFVIQDGKKLRVRANRFTWIPIIALLSICTFLCINVALGLFGILSYSISKRRSEIGLRRAMGASAGDIAMQFTLEIVILTLCAIALGVFFAIQIPLLKVIDINTSVFYRAIFFAGLVIVAVVAVCALYPSFQASQIQPATALHED